jgi:hypothetical protein
MSTALAGIEHTLERLAAFTSATDPVVSLYLDLRPDQHGRRRHAEFFERAMADQIATFEPSSPARRRLERDTQRIDEFLQRHIETPAQMAAVFCCSGEPDLFEAIQLDAAGGGHRLYIDRHPHLFPLLRAMDAYATYAALVFDTNAARLYVFAVGALQRKLVVRNEKPSRTPGVDVFSEGEYQRNSDNLHVQHMKEVAGLVERVVRQERVQQVFVAGSSAAMPLLRRELPREVEARLTEVSRLDMKSPDADVLRATMEAFRQADARSDRDDVARVLNAFRSRGLGTIGLPRVRAALTLGQVDRVLVPATAKAPFAEAMSPEAAASAAKVRPPSLSEPAIEELLHMARSTDAAITFIEDAELLDAAGGVGAFLRFRLSDAEAGSF